MLKDLVRLKPETVELWTGSRWSRVKSWTKGPTPDRAFEIVLRSGERIGCTADHRWPTQRGIVRADELLKGDVLETTRLPDNLRASGWITDEAFWFAGLYLAEGNLSGDTIQIAGHVRNKSRWCRIQALAEHYGASARLYNWGQKQGIHLDRAASLNAVLKTLIAGRTAKASA